MDDFKPSIPVMFLRAELKTYLEKPERTRVGFVNKNNLYGRGLTKQEIEYILRPVAADGPTLKLKRSKR